MGAPFDAGSADSHGVEIRPLDIYDRGTAERVLELQAVSYRVEAELIGSDAIPPLHDTAELLRASGETFLGAWEGNRLLGAVSWKCVGDTLDIHRLMVHPKAFRRGIGRRLVAQALRSEPTVRRAVVSTGRDNAPALALYTGLGFRVVQEREVVPGLVITELEKEPDDPTVNSFDRE